MQKNKIKILLAEDDVSMGFLLAEYLEDNSFDYNSQSLLHNGSTKRLTKKEAEIMRMLCLSKNSIAKREEILLSVWVQNDDFTGRSLDVFITKLRKYLVKDVTIKIESISRVGYILSDK
ncbi:MAG: winged helix-turn-helix domain-containing protein [Bacteroidota bacterium]